MAVSIPNNLISWIMSINHDNHITIRSIKLRISYYIISSKILKQRRKNLDDDIRSVEENRFKTLLHKSILERLSLAWGRKRRQELQWKKPTRKIRCAHHVYEKDGRSSFPFVELYENLPLQKSCKEKGRRM